MKSPHQILKHCQSGKNRTLNFPKTVQKLFVFALLQMLCIGAWAQSIGLVYFDDTRTYQQGGTIALHLNPQGEFPFTNRFVLQLMDAAGTTVVTNEIGQANEFFVPVLNGTLPAGLAPGTYRLRVQARNGAAVVATSLPSAPFTVAGVAGTPRATIQPTSAQLQIRCFNESNFFGSVNNAITASTPSVSFAITNYDAAFTYNVLLIDHPGGTTTPLNVNILGGNATFNLPAGRPVGYYTLQINKTNASGTVSFGFIYLFATGNTSLGNLSSEEVCVGLDVLFSNDRQVIFRNYPGSFYTVNYGDGTKIDTFTHARFIQDSIFSHQYNLPTCQSTGGTNVNGRYIVEILLFNKGIFSGGNTNCDSYVRNGNGTQKQVNTSLAPIAGLLAPPGTCINNSITVANQTLSGSYGEGNQCLTNPNINYFIRRPGTTDFIPLPAEWSDNPTRSLVIPPNILDQIGLWQIKIEAQNPQGCNTITEAIATLCVEPILEPSFLMNQADSVVVCESTETNVSIRNTTDTTNLCASPTFRWRVYRNNDTLLISGVDYTILPSENDPNPQFVFTRPGNYRIEMVVETYCLPVVASRNLRVQSGGRPGAVRLPGNAGYCGTDRIIDFATEGAHRPSYSSNNGNETYVWTITGGNHAFVNGTTNGSRFPQIRFSDFGTYNVAVEFTNACGTADTFQLITFSEPITVEAGQDRTICFVQDTVMLTGSANPVSGVLWSTAGSGSFSATGSLSTAYTLSTADKNNGSVTLRLQGLPVQGSFCPSVLDSLTISVLPDNRGTNASLAICSGTALNFVPTSSIAGSTYTWTSTVTAGSASGNTASGTGNITDVLVNNSTTEPAVVQYTIIPIANNCDGIPFTYTVSINPIPQFVAQPQQDTICSGTAVGINLSSGAAGIRYSWTSTVLSGTVTGHTNASNQSGPIADILNNTGTTYAVVRYTISARGPVPTNCAARDTVIDVVVTPVTSQAQAGPDQLLCDPGQVQLNATVPAVGTGTWRQLTGPATTIANAASANTLVTGLLPDQAYSFRWTVRSLTAFCDSTTDDVVITVRPRTTQANAGEDTTICITGNNTFRLGANAPRSFEQGRWFLLSSTFTPNPTFSSATNRNANLNGLQPGTVRVRWRIQSDAPGCSETNDTLVLTIVPPTPLANAGPNQLLCNLTGATLNATPVAGTAFGTWTVLTPPEVNIANATNPQTTVSNLVVGNNQLIWTVQDNICPQVNRDTVSIIVRPPTTQAFAGNDTSICVSGNASFTLRANAPEFFETGNWAVVSSSFSPAPTLANVSNATTTLNGLQPGTVRVRWRISSDAPGCEPTFDTITISIGPGTAIANAGPNQLLCDVTTAQLSASPVGANSTGSWTVVAPSTATVAAPANPASAVAGLLVGENRFVWTVTDALCPQVNRDTVLITVRPPTTQAALGNDTAICVTGNGTFALAGNAPRSFERVQWTIVNTDMVPPPSFSNALAPNTNIVGLRPGQVRVRYTITSEAADCVPTSDEKLITVGPATAIANAGPDQLLCDVTSTQLAATPVGGNSTGTWTVVPASTATIASPNNAATQVANMLLPGTYRFAWTITDQLCPQVNSDTMQVVIRPSTTVARVGDDTTICIVGNTNFGLRANAVLPNETGRWTIVNTTMAPAPGFSDVANPNATLLGMRAGTITVRWTITSDAPDCAPTFAQQTIVVSPPTDDANAGPNQILCAQTETVLNATPVTGLSTGLWTVIAPPGLSVAQPNNAASTVANLIIGENTLVWTVSNPVCAAVNRDTVLITVRPTTTQANAGTDTAFCTTGNPTYTLQANTPRSFEQGRWTIVSSTILPQPSLSNVAAPNATLSGLRPGTVTLRWTITSDAPDCPPTTDDVTIEVGNATPEANAGPNQLLCNVTSTTLAATPVSGRATGAWSVVAPAGAQVANLNNPASVVNNLLVGAQQLVWTVTDELCSQVNRDTVLITVRPPTTQATAGADTAFCTTGNPTFTLQGNAPLGTEQGRWTIVATTISPSPSINNPANPNASLSGLRPGVVTLRWTITSDAAGCAPTTDDVTISVGPATPDANAGPDQLLCNVTSTTLAATPVSGTAIGTWTVVPPAGATVAQANNPAATAANLLVGTQAFAWTVTDQLCPQVNRDTVLVTVRPPTTQANAGRDTAFCATGNTTFGLQANTPLPHEQGRWTLVSSSFSPNPSILGPTSAQTQIGGLRAGTVVLRWTISSDAPGCTPTSSDITLTIGPGTSDAFAGVDQLLCNVTSTTLAATPVSGNSIGTWTVVAPSPATVSQVNNVGSTVSNLLIGDNLLAWTVTDALCPQINSDTMVVTVRPPTTQANAGRDTVLCITGNATYPLAANMPRAFERGNWSIAPGSTFSPAFSNVSSPTATLSNLQPGRLILRWTISSDAPGCDPTESLVTIDIADTAAAALAGPDQILCNGFTTALNAAPVSGFSIGNWTAVPPSGGAIANAASPSTQVSNLVLGSNRFVWTVSSTVCTNVNRDTVNIIVRPPVTQAAAGPDSILCGTQSSAYQLQGNVPAAFETGTWRIVARTMGGTPVLNNPNLPNATVSGLQVGTITLEWRITNDGDCPPTTDTVVITLTPASAPANAGPDQAICGATLTQLNATAVSGINTGSWTIVQPNSAQVANAFDPQSNVIDLPLGITRLVWTVTNNVCPANRDTVVVERFPALVNRIQDTATICEGQSVTLVNREVSGGNGTYTYQWQQSTNNVTFSNIPGATSANLTVSPTVTTWYRRVVTSLPCVGPSDTVQIVVLGRIENNSIAANQEICINTAPALINGSLPTGGGGNYNYVWQSSTNNGATWTTIPGADLQSYQPPVLSANIAYRRIVSTFLCDGAQRDTSNIVRITINPDAVAIINPLLTEDCASWRITNAIVNPTLRPDVNSNYQWYVNGSLVGNGPVFPGTTITLPGDSVLIKMVAISRFGCKNDSASAWFYTRPDPVPGFVLSDTVGCGPLPVLISNTTQDTARYTFFWDFGQGQTSTLTSPGTVIFPPNPTFMDTVYTVTLRATAGCDTISIAQPIRIKSKPKAIFTPNRIEGCSPLTVTFRNTSIGTNMGFVWLFGDGTRLETQDALVTHIYTTNRLDTFYARLVAFNECGGDTAVFPIIVAPNEIVLDFAISGLERNGCMPHTVNFINNSAGATLFVWDFGDGFTTTTTRNRDTVRHTYFTPGDYTVTLFATNGCSDTTDIERVTVEATPRVGFNAAPTPVCIGDTVRFVNTSEPAAYRWNFGDGSGSIATNVNKIYRQPGTYRVLLTATREYPSGLACADSIFRDIQVVDTLPATMIVSATEGNCVPFTVTFRNPVADGFSTTWNFGDGSTAVGNEVTHTFTRVGTFRVTMNTQVSSGCNYLAVQDIVVNGPTGTLRYNAGFACFGEPVRFEVISGAAQQYIFVFGDGDSMVTNSPIVSHTFTRPGAFVPYLVLANGTCRIISRPGDTLYVDRVRSGFRFGLEQVCGSTTVTFTDTSSATFGLAGRRWDLGDGTTSTLATVSRTITASGPYRITLAALGTSGCADTTVRTINVPVWEVPGVNIKGNPILCQGGSNVLEADIVSADSVVSILWNFGNGQQAQGPRVTANYVNAGTYTITLTVRTIFGCTATIQREVVVNPTPVVGTSNDVTLCRGQSTILFATGADRYIWNPTDGLSCFDCPSPIATPQTTTRYSVTGFNQFGCSSTDTITVTVAQRFQISATPADSICIGAGKQLQATGASRYQWSPAAGLSNPNIADPFARPTISTTYRVVGFDDVNCFTDTAFVRIGVGPIPTVELGSGALVVAGTRITFNPVITGGPIRDYIWSPTTLLSCTNCPNPVATIDNEITYSLRVRNFYGCEATDTISYQVFCREDQVFIPNAFSPDGDGINDVLYVMGRGIVRVQHFRVFNRFGQVVFERNNFDANDPSAGWDGKINGVPASPDVYVYTAEVVCSSGGTTFSYKGNVTLFR